MKCVKNNTVTIVISKKNTMALNWFQIWMLLWGKEGLIKGLWEDEEKMWREFLGIFSEVLETHATGFFNYVPFYYHTCVLHFLNFNFLISTAVKLWLFSLCKLTVELRKVKRIYWDDCKVVGRWKERWRHYNELGFMSEKVPEEKWTEWGSGHR